MVAAAGSTGGRERGRVWWLHSEATGSESGNGGSRVPQGTLLVLRDSRQAMCDSARRAAVVGRWHTSAALPHRAPRVAATTQLAEPTRRSRPRGRRSAWQSPSALPPGPPLPSGAHQPVPVLGRLLPCPSPVSFRSRVWVKPMCSHSAFMFTSKNCHRGRENASERLEMESRVSARARLSRYPGDSVVSPGVGGSYGDVAL